jgi:N-alpha-acetyltransferase 15/16, NatA auxiliary subunit
MQFNLIHLFLSLVNLICREYDEARKSFVQASKIDKENFQILRDLAVVQMHQRDYENLCETRRKLLNLRPSASAHWTALSIANYFVN